MSKKEDIIGKIRAGKHMEYDMPDLSLLNATTFADPVDEFRRMSKHSGADVVDAADGDDIDFVDVAADGDDINEIVRRAYPDAKAIASNLDCVTIANRTPDTVDEAQDLNGTDVAVVKGDLGVAENGCVWIPQTMKERAVCFIAEYLVIILKRSDIVSNMHEAYARIKTNDYGYGCFISGPSKTADIAQALVMGAQAARGVTVVLV